MNFRTVSERVLTALAKTIISSLVVVGFLTTFSTSAFANEYESCQLNDSLSIVSTPQTRLMTTGPTSVDVSVELPAGSHAVWLQTFDGHTGRDTEPAQTDERLEIEFFDADGNRVATVGASDDLEDGVENAIFTGEIGDFETTVPVTEMTIRHASSDTSLPHSVTPICVGFDSQEAEQEEDTDPISCQELVAQIEELNKQIAEIEAGNDNSDVSAVQDELATVTAELESSDTCDPLDDDSNGGGGNNDDDTNGDDINGGGGDDADNSCNELEAILEKIAYLEGMTDGYVVDVDGSQDNLDQLLADLAAYQEKANSLSDCPDDNDGSGGGSNDQNDDTTGGDTTGGDTTQDDTCDVDALTAEKTALETELADDSLGLTDEEKTAKTDRITQIDTLLASAACQTTDSTGGGGGGSSDDSNDTTEGDGSSASNGSGGGSSGGGGGRRRNRNNNDDSDTDTASDGGSIDGNEDGEILGASSCAAPVFEPDQSLGYGSKGPAVRTLQTFLNHVLDDTNLVVDGDFGTQTKAAVMRFQALYREDILDIYQGLVPNPTGYFGPASIGKANQLLGCTHQINLHCPWPGQDMLTYLLEELDPAMVIDIAILNI